MSSLAHSSPILSVKSLTLITLKSHAWVRRHLLRLLRMHQHVQKIARQRVVLQAVMDLFADNINHHGEFTQVCFNGRFGGRFDGHYLFPSLSHPHQQLMHSLNPALLSHRLPQTPTHLAHLSLTRRSRSSQKPMSVGTVLTWAGGIHTLPHPPISAHNPHFNPFSHFKTSQNHK